MSAGNCGYPDGVVHAHAGRCYAAGQRDAVAALLTPEEHAVVNQAGELWNAICAAIPEGPTRDSDLRELIGHVHAIQHAFMAQAAGRAYPETYRRLGLLRAGARSS